MQHKRFKYYCLTSTDTIEPVLNCCMVLAFRLYPYGPGQGDTAMPHVDDTSSPTIPLPDGFKVGLQQESTAYVWTWHMYFRIYLVCLIVVI